MASQTAVGGDVHPCSSLSVGTGRRLGDGLSALKLAHDRL